MAVIVVQGTGLRCIVLVEALWALLRIILRVQPMHQLKNIRVFVGKYFSLFPIEVHTVQIILLRGTRVNRTYGTRKNIYIYPCLPTIFGPIYYCMFPRNRGYGKPNFNANQVF